MSTPAKVTKIVGGRLVLEHEVLEDGALLLAGGKIAYVGPNQTLPEVVSPPGTTQSLQVSDAEEYDARGGWVFPGFIDLHVHGGRGSDTMHGNVKAIETISAAHAAHGTTAFLPTTMTTAHRDVMAAASAVREAMNRWEKAPWHGARPIGMHLEGPYINPERAGAQNPEHMRRADLEELGQILSVLEDGFKLVTLAPELPGGLDAVRYLHRAGVTVSMGHTDATIDQAQEAFAAGVTHVTHTYNGMRGLHHREPGTVGAALLADVPMCEVIADGIHVHRDAIRLLFKMRGAGSICLITDAIEATDMAEGTYQLGGLKVTVKDGACRLDSGSLAGSILTTDRAVRFMINQVGASPVEAARMAACNPAKQARVDHRKGSLKMGKDADVVVLDEVLRPVRVWVEGRCVHTQGWKKGPE